MDEEEQGADVTQRIVIVGNGPVPDGAGAAIARADRVIRFNDCRSFRPGERTDVVAVCNTGRPARAMLSSSAWALHPAVVAAREIWGVRDPAFFDALRAPLAISHPELDDFCDDGAPGFATFAAISGKSFHTLDAALHRRVTAALAPFSPASDYVVPSSGLMVIAALLEDAPSAEILLTGFTHQGWEGHPFAAEARLVDSWVQAGRLQRLATAPVARAAQA